MKLSTCFKQKYFPCVANKSCDKIAPLQDSAINGYESSSFNHLHKVVRPIFAPTPRITSDGIQAYQTINYLKFAFPRVNFTAISYKIVSKENNILRSIE